MPSYAQHAASRRRLAAWMKGPTDVVHAETCELCSLIDGQLHVQLGDPQGIQRRGEVSVISPGTLHSSWTEEDAIEESVVHLDGPRLQAIICAGVLTAGIRPLQDSAAISMELIAACIDNEVELERRLLALVKLLVDLPSELAISDPRLRVVDAVRLRMTEPWTVPSMAKLAAMSPAHFSRHFHEVVGPPPKGPQVVRA